MGIAKSDITGRVYGHFKYLLYIAVFLTSHSLAQENIPEGYQYLFPGPGAEYVHPGSSIILRFAYLSPGELANPETLIRVSGETSGILPGKITLSSDNQTLIFSPEESYKSGEKVKVTIDPGKFGISKNHLRSFNYEFTVLEEVSIENSFPDEESIIIPGQKKSTAANQPRIMSNGVSVPADFPHVNITNNFNPSDDYVFINNWDPPYYNIIFDTSGDPVWYWKTPDRRNDFKVQDNGWITMLVEDGYGGSGTGFIALDQNFNFIKSMRAANGYTTDEHDLYMLPDNGYILIGQRETRVDMSQYVEGGQTDATVRETCIQEFTADDQLIFIWRSWDHFDIRDLELEILTGSYIRFPHINAVFTDDDGHILLSSRHLSEISKIHRHSGEFIWRLSGIPDSPNNDFEFVRDPLDGFRNQHAIRALGNNTYGFFDNGNMHDPPESRALEYEIDTVNMEATMVWEYKSAYERSFVSHLGNTQRLANGNTHINWAYGNVLPVASEVTPEGDIVFEMWFEEGDRCYRSFRHPWNGISQVPYLLLEPQVDNLTLLINKFGDDGVDYYKIYGGNSPNPGNVIDTSRNSLKRLVDLEKGRHYYFRVTAVDQYGVESGFSNEEDVILRDVEPGSNLIINGDFTYGLDAWTWEVDSTARAEVHVSDSVCNFQIQQRGDYYHSVQLWQNNIPLIQGQNYLFEFDAWADTARIVELVVGVDHPSFTDYSRIGYTSLTPSFERHTYMFEMTDATDLNARVSIRAGTAPEDIYIDNISLKLNVQSNTPDRHQTDTKFLLHPNYPNPFNSSTQIDYDLPETGKVRLSIYDMLGQLIEDYYLAQQTAGSHSQEVHLSHLSSGVYFYSLELRALHSGRRYQLTNRMVLLK